MKFDINSALKQYGGFVRYYDSTENLRELAELAAAGDRGDVLACCGGGDQALTILGAGHRKGLLWAVDTNAAQLFVLAAKANFLEQKGIIPAFEQVQKAYPGRVAPVKMNIRSMRQLPLIHAITGKKSDAPASIAERYKFVTDDEMLVLRNSGPYWKNDPVFISQLRVRLASLRLLHMDIFDGPDRFKPGSLDLIYLSDIYWPEPLLYYRAKLAMMLALLRPGGRIITCLSPGNDFMGQGVSPGRILSKMAKK